MKHDGYTSIGKPVPEFDHLNLPIPMIIFMINQPAPLELSQLIALVKISL